MKKFVNNEELFKSELLDHLKSGKGLWSFHERANINVNVSTTKLWMKKHPEAFEPYRNLVECGNKRRAANTIICEECLAAIFWFDVNDVKKIEKNQSYFSILQTLWKNQDESKKVCPFCGKNPFKQHNKTKFLNAKREIVLETII